MSNLASPFHSLPSFTFVFLLFLFTPSYVHSQLLPEGTQTTLLDVSASLQMAHDLLSFHPQTLTKQKQTTPPLPTSSSFTLPLHPRDALLRRPSHTDYKSLTLARLERDSARVKWLYTKLDLAIKGTKMSDIQVPVVSGTSQGSSGEYLSRVGIGSPPKPQYLILDTGSDITWVQCQPCNDCYQQTDPIFQPSSSSSFSQLSCNTQQCRALDEPVCRNGSCLYIVMYGDGSHTVGDFVSETITFGDSGSVQKIAIGCGHDNEGLFNGSSGLLGLGGGSVSFPSQLNTTAFSYCLVDRDSTTASTLEFGSIPQLTNTVTSPLVKNRQIKTFYYIGLTGISVGGRLLPISPSVFTVDESGSGGIVVDSGTVITRLQTGAYNSLRDAFVEGTKNLKSAGGKSLFDTCYDLSLKKTVDVPTVAFHFPGGGKLTLAAKNYLIPVDSNGTFCFAFAPTSESFSVMGSVQQQGIRVTFDLKNSLVRFSPNQC